MPVGTQQPVPFEGAPGVRGFLHRPENPAGDVIVLSHGAGSDANAPLLVNMARIFAGAGFTVLRLNLPYRQARPKGPPLPGSAARDREGLRLAVQDARTLASEDGRIFLGGHSYGGRQSTMLAAENPGLANGLLLLSYPLHPPNRPDQLRASHFPALHTPALFVHGSRDPFGSLAEMTEALQLIVAPTRLVAIDGAAHELAHGRTVKGTAKSVPEVVLDCFREFFPAR